MSDSLTRFRIVALAEGLSYVVLVFIGMPLKYLADQPGTVEVVGWIHGFLFIAYLLLGVMAAADEEWSKRFMGWAFAAAMVPGGTFYLDRYLREGSETTPAGEATDG